MEIPNAGEIDRSAGAPRLLWIDSSGIWRPSRVTEGARWIGVDTGSRRTSESVFEANLELLQPLIDFLTERGRLPHDTELEQLSLIEDEFGSARRAYSLIVVSRGVNGGRTSKRDRKARLLVYLALSAFGGRPRFGELPPDLQHDARDLFRNYKEAIAQADKLLFAVGNQEAIEVTCRSAAFGKLTPEALYVHVAGVSQVTGDTEDLHRLCGNAHRKSERSNHSPDASIEAPGLLPRLPGFRPNSSSHSPDIDREQNPRASRELQGLLKPRKPTTPPPQGKLRTGRLSRSREKFERLTLQEERAGLLSDPSIGTFAGWNSALEQAGINCGAIGLSEGLTSSVYWLSPRRTTSRQSHSVVLR